MKGKKRSLWFVTAVMFMLTVLTTSMGAGTYAKFVSRVSASGGSKSAGFLITSTNSTSEVDLSASTLIAPGQSKNIDINFSYYSQVLTQFKSNTNDVTVTGTGALEGNFFALVDEYNSTWLPLHKDFYADNNKKAPSSLSEMFSISFNGSSSIAEACALAVGKASNGSLAVNGSVVEAMPNNATQSLSCSITATLKWEEVSDAWDTFIGNEVYEYMQNNPTKHTGITVNIGVTAEQCFSVLVDGTTNIPNGYFQGRKDIKEVVIPEGVTSIGANSFNGCTNLEKIEIPQGVTTIGNGAFQNCTSLKEVTIPATVKTISDNTFQNCTNLESVTIPEGVKSIGWGAFEGCDSLTEIEIPSTLTSLGAYAFRNASGLTKVTLSGDALTSIQGSVFLGSNSIVYNQDDNGCYLGNESNPYIMLVKPTSTTISSIDINENCKLISGSALQGCTNITELTVPEGVTTIGDYAILRCLNLTKISLPSTFVNIGDRILNSCPALSEIAIDESNPTFRAVNTCIINKQTKRAWAIGTNPVLPDDGSVETLALWLTNGTLYIPKSVKRLVSAVGTAEYGTSNLQITVDPESPYLMIKNNCIIEKQTNTLVFGYGNCSIPDDGSVKNIREYSFYQNNYIENIIIPNSVTVILNNAFHGCNNLKEVTISKIVTSIDESAFYNCTKLKTIRFTGTPEEWAAKSYSTQEQFKGKNIIFNA